MAKEYEQKRANMEKKKDEYEQRVAKKYEQKRANMEKKKEEYEQLIADIANDKGVIAEKKRYERLQDDLAQKRAKMEKKRERYEQKRANMEKKNKEYEQHLAKEYELRCADMEKKREEYEQLIANDKGVIAEKKRYERLQDDMKKKREEYEQLIADIANDKGVIAEKKRYERLQDELKAKIKSINCDEIITQKNAKLDEIISKVIQREEELKKKIDTDEGIKAKRAELAAIIEDQKVHESALKDEVKMAIMTKISETKAAAASMGDAAVLLAHSAKSNATDEGDSSAVNALKFPNDADGPVTKVYHKVLPTKEELKKIDTTTRRCDVASPNDEELKWFDLSEAGMYRATMDGVKNAEKFRANCGFKCPDPTPPGGNSNILYTTFAVKKKG